ncbi:BatD family protein [Rhodobacteraceae bacterium NNCM2]|nr:BatD family protein [Coraliihabitans acroporae]
MVAGRWIFAVLICLFAATAPAMADTELTPDQARIELVFANPRHPLIEGEMILATYRGYYDVPITLEEFSVPRMRDFDWVQLARDKWSVQVVDGREVRVMERPMAFFPQRSGELKLKAATHDLTILTPGGKREQRVIQTAPLVIEVSPAPAAPGTWWLPASAIESSDTWAAQADTLNDGDSVERRVTLRVLGATDKMIPPQPRMREPWLITFRSPEERTTELTPAGPLTTVTWTWTLRPKTGEPGVIPEVQIPWFDTIEREAKSVRLKATPIGYAGFGDNNVVNWQRDFSGAWRMLVAGIAGALCAAILMAPGGRIRRREELLARLRSLLPDRRIRSLRKAGRNADMKSFRRIALTGSDGAEKARILAAIAPLDRHLFGPERQGDEPDLEVLADRIGELGRARHHG